MPSDKESLKHNAAAIRVSLECAIKNYRLAASMSSQLQWKLQINSLLREAERLGVKEEDLNLRI
jgi:hypothetical protein